MLDETADKLNSLKADYNGKTWAVFSMNCLSSMGYQEPSDADAKECYRSFQKAREALDEFCLATGHDLEELKKFYQDVDASLVFYLGT